MTIEYRTTAGKRWHEIWHGLPRAGLVPFRSAFDPAMARDILPYVTIHDLSEPGVSRMRLIGTDVVERYGFDPTGRDYLEFVEPARRPHALAAMRAPVDRPCGMRVLVETHYSSTRAAILETTAFPLLRDDGKGPLLMFANQTCGRPGRLSGEQSKLMRIRVLRRDFIDIGAGVPPPLDEDLSECAEA